MTLQLNAILNSNKFEASRKQLGCCLQTCWGDPSCQGADCRMFNLPPGTPYKTAQWWQSTDINPEPSCPRLGLCGIFLLEKKPILIIIDYLAKADVLLYALTFHSIKHLESTCGKPMPFKGKENIISFSENSSSQKENKAYIKARDISSTSFFTSLAVNCFSMLISCNTWMNHTVKWHSYVVIITGESCFFNLLGVKQNPSF